MSSLNIVVRNLPGDPSNILRGVMRNPLKLAPNSRVGLSSINITRQIEEITVDMDSSITVQTDGGPLFDYKIHQGIYSPAELLTAVQHILNKSCIPFSNFQRNKSNNSLVGFNPTNINNGSKITGMLVWSGTSHSEIIVNTQAGNPAITRYAESLITPTAADGSDFTNLTPNISFADPAAGKLIITPGGSSNFGFIFAKKQSNGSWNTAFLINSEQVSTIQSLTITGTNGEESVNWNFLFTYTAGRIMRVGASVSINDVTLVNIDIGERAINEAGASKNVQVAPYRIGGRLGFCLFADVGERMEPFYGASTSESDDISDEWQNLTFAVTGTANFGNPATQYVVNKILQTKSTIPTSQPFTPLFINYGEVALSNTPEILENAALNAKLAAEYEEIKKRDEEMGIFITEDDLTDAPPISLVDEPENLQVLPRPKAYLIPGEMAQYLGFIYSGYPTNGEKPPYIFNPDNTSNTIIAENEMVGDATIYPLIVASRSIPLRGCAFMDDGASQDVSILDSIVAVYTSGKTFQGNYRPPLYASVNNKSEMTITELRFDLLDIDGISPFEVLPGAVIVINIQGAM